MRVVHSIAAYCLSKSHLLGASISQAYPREAAGIYDGSCLYYAEVIMIIFCPADYVTNLASSVVKFFQRKVVGVWRLKQRAVYAEWPLFADQMHLQIHHQHRNWT